MTDARRKTLLKAKRAILKSREDLLTFAKYMRPDPKAPEDPEATTYSVARHHEFMADKLQDLEAGNIKRLILSLPPRAGKSELAQKTFVPWVMGRNPEWHVITATYNQNFAEDFGRAVRHILLDPRYQNVFPGHLPRKGAVSANRIEMENRSLAHFVGRGGALTGRGGHLLALDDPIKDRSEADSPTIRDTLWQWFTQVLMSRQMNDQARVLIIQTRWHEDDIVGRLTDPRNPHYSALRAQRWTVVNIPALALPNDPLGRKEGEALWPERFSAAELAETRDSDPRGFSALYQGNPSPDDGLFFGPEDIREYHRMSDFPLDCTMYLTSDHAVSTEQWADKSAFLLFGVDGDDNVWVHPDTVLKKLDAERAVDTLLHLIRVHRPALWWAESGHITKSLGPFIRKRMAEERLFTAIVEMTPVKDKQTRAQAIKGRMSMQKVYFPSWASWYKEARNQIMTFPAGTKDDFVDALSLVGLGLAMHNRPRRKAPKKEHAPGTFGHMIEQTRQRERRDRITKLTDGW